MFDLNMIAGRQPANCEVQQRAAEAAPFFMEVHLLAEDIRDLQAKLAEKRKLHSAAVAKAKIFVSMRDQ